MSKINTRSKSIFVLLVSLGIVFLLCLIVTTPFVIGIIRVNVIEGNSMNPTYQDGTYVVSSSVSQNYVQGDIVLYEQNSVVFVQRVIAVGGDEVFFNIDSEGVLVNGKAENYGSGKTILNGNVLEESFVVPDNFLLLLGDNRMQSRDSRLNGLINKNKVKGKILFSL
jgi:signal peptidase I